MKEKFLLKNKDYLILFFGQTVSNFGSSVDSLIYPLLILFLTNSPFMAGVGSLIVALPTFLFGLFAGAWIDRTNRKKVMIFSDLGRFVTTGAIPVFAFLGILNIYTLLLFAFLEVSFGTFFSIAETPALLKIVGKEKLTVAMAQNETSNNIVGLVGPSVGGFIYQGLGKTIPFMVDSISYLVSVISLLFVKTEFQEERLEQTNSIKEQIFEGFIWIYRKRIIFVTSLLVVGGAFVGGGANLAIILIAKNLGATAGEIGLIFSVGTIGIILGSLITNEITNRLTVIKVIILARWIMVFAMPLFIIAPSVGVVGIITALYFFTGPLYGIPLSSLRVSLTPDELQGRVSSVYRLVTVGSFSTGAFISGFLLQYLGIKPTIIVFSLILFILAVIATFYLKEEEI